MDCLTLSSFAQHYVYQLHPSVQVKMKNDCHSFSFLHTKDLTGVKINEIALSVGQGTH